MGKIYNVETTVTVAQTVTVTSNDCAKYVLGQDSTKLSFHEWTEEEINNTAAGMARERIIDTITKASLQNPMEVTEIGTQEFV